VLLARLKDTVEALSPGFDFSGTEEGIGDIRVEGLRSVRFEQFVNCPMLG